MNTSQACGAVARVQRNHSGVVLLLVGLLVVGWLALPMQVAAQHDVGAARGSEASAVPATSISGRIWHDRDYDGALDADEQGLPNVVVRLYPFDCGSFTGEADGSSGDSAITDAAGAFSFVTGKLNSATNCLRVLPESLPDDYVSTNGPHMIDVAVGNGQSHFFQFGYASAYSGERLAVGVYRPCTDAAWLYQIAAEHNAVVLHGNRRSCNFILGFAEGVGPDLQAALQADSRTRYAEYDVRANNAYSPNDPYYNNPSYVYGPQQIEAPAAWDKTLGDPNLIVAIVDTGVDPAHPEFAGRLLSGYDFVNEDSDPRDDKGHGTHVAGIAAAGINNGIGIAGIAGRSKILPVKVLNQDGSGWWSDVAAGVTWAVDQGAKVINMSLAGAYGSSSLLDALNYAVAHNVLVVASAGNDNTDQLLYPASYDQVLAVGATTSTGVRWSLSNYGPNVDVMAPGSSIYSSVWSASAGSTYGFMSGTSMAAPHVAGVAALLFSLNPNLSVAEVKQAILRTAADMGAPGVDPLHGYGLINARAAVDSVPIGSYTPPATSMKWQLVNDLNGNGYVDPNDRVRYLTTVANQGDTELASVVVINQLPAHTSYVPASTTVDGIAVLDNTVPPAGSALPLDEGGLNVGPIPAGDESIVAFDVVVGQPPPAFYSIVNQATVNDGQTTVTVSTETPVGGVACAVNFSNSTGASITVHPENSAVVVHLTDADQNTNAAAVESVSVRVRNPARNDEEWIVAMETGPNTGQFRGQIPSSRSSGSLSGDGVLYAIANDTLEASYTDADFSPDTCTQTATVVGEAKIGDRVWQEFDGDNVYNPAKGDLPIAGATVELSRGGAVIATTMTGADGSYRFGGLELRNYSVRVSQVSATQNLYTVAAPGPQLGADHNNQVQPYQVTLTTTQLQNWTADFGYVLRGDCNADKMVDAGDSSALTLEVFDGDGEAASDAHGGTFRGSGAGCDANQDIIINAGDSTCLSLLVLNGSGACQLPDTQPQGAPELIIPSQIPAQAGGTVVAPVNFRSGDNAISAIMFSIDYDQSWLTVDPTDADGDGIPDAITFDVPAEFGVRIVQFDAQNTTAEIKIEIRDGSVPLATLPDRDGIVRIQFRVGWPGSATVAPVRFGSQPVASFGSNIGTSVLGTTEDGSVTISPSQTLGRLGGFTWVDTNADGVYDPGLELPMNGVGIEVRNSQGNLIAMVVSGASGGFEPGKYEVVGLAAGTYTVKAVDVPTGYALLPPSNLTTKLSPGGEAMELNFAVSSATGLALATLSVERQGGRVVVRWTSVGETNDVSFHVYRALQMNGPYERLTVVPVSANCVIAGIAEYQWIDAAAAPGLSYWYSVMALPDEIMFGPVALRQQGDRVFLPLIN